MCVRDLHRNSRDRGEQVRAYTAIEQVMITGQEFSPRDLHRGTAHLVIKFPGSNKQSTISIVEPEKTASYTEEDAGKFKVSEQ